MNGFAVTCSLPPHEDSRRAGKHGILSLKFAREKQRTVLLESFSKIPMQAFPPFYPDETGWAYSYLVNPTGGLVGGDRIEIEMALDEQAHVFVSTPSATKVYKTLGDVSSQEIKVIIKRGSVFEYMPAAIIPFAQSAYHQKTTVHMEEGTAALILDFFTTGRLGRGENLQFSEYRSSFEVEYGEDLIVSERMLLKPKDVDYRLLGFLESGCAVAALYFIFDNPDAEKRLVEDLYSVIQGMGEVIAGVSSLPSKGVVVRLLGKATRFIERAVLEIWSIVRKKILATESYSPIHRLVPF